MNAKVEIHYGQPGTRPIGAGVLPYMHRKSTTGGDPEVLLLLGQEEFRCDWNQGGCWSGFEGRAHDGEDMYQTAAREFVEETMASVPINNSTDIETVAQSLRDGHYTLSLCVTQTPRRPHQVTTRCHVTFLVEIPWNEDIPSTFDRVRRPMAKLHAACSFLENIEAREASQGAGSRKVRGAASRAWDIYSAMPDDLRLHPAVNVSGAPPDPRRITMRAEYIEKRSVALFTPVQLASLFHSTMHRQRLRLRFRFVPVLKTVIQCLPLLVQSHISSSSARVCGESSPPDRPETCLRESVGTESSSRPGPSGSLSGTVCDTIDETPPVLTSADGRNIQSAGDPGAGNQLCPINA